MSSVSIRAMKRKDCEGAYEIETLSFPDTSWTLEDFYASLSIESQYYFVAEKEGKIAGFAALYIMADCGDLVNIAVHPAFRGQGISCMLMEMLLETAKDMALENITLEVRESNAAAIHLYLKYGFEKISTRQGYYKNPLEDADIMQKHMGE